MRSVTRSAESQYCLKLPGAVFGSVGDVLGVVSSSRGIILDSNPNAAFGQFNFRAGNYSRSLLGGTVDRSNGKYLSPTIFQFVDTQSDSGTAPYYMVMLTRSGKLIRINTACHGTIINDSCLIEAQN